MVKSQEFYPSSDCRNFGVEYVDDRKFWQETLNSILFFDEDAVGIIQTFHLCADTGKDAIDYICQQDGITSDVASCVRGIEGRSIEDKYHYVNCVEKALGRQLKRALKNLILTAVRPVSRIKKLKFLLWHSSDIEQPYTIFTFILYEDGENLCYVIADTIDGVRPHSWSQNPTAWDTVLTDIYGSGYQTLKGSKSFLDATKEKILAQFPEKFARP